jgi:interleukin-1 receptor-associated kinase 1
MKFDTMTIQDLRREVLRGNSPSDELLTLWGHQNHTVLELFVLLSEMQHYQAMLVLKPFGECMIFLK